MSVGSKKYKEARKAKNHAMTRATNSIVEFAKTVHVFSTPTTMGSWAKDEFMGDKGKDK